MIVRKGGVAMSGEENKHTKRSEQTSRTHRRNLNKMDKTLNYLIAIVSLLIVLTLVFIFVGNDEKDHKQIAEEEQQENNESQVGQGSEDEEDEENQEDEEQNGAAHNGEAGSDEQTTDIDDQGKVTVNASSDPVVKEVWQNESWQPYPTAQQGAHVSTFKKGHIDYEEKLGAIFSVIPLTKEESIVWRIQNNGNASSAIAVLSSTDKESKYRVSIEWVDGQGWKPVLVEVLNTLEGAY